MNAEQRVRLMIGDLMVTNANLMSQIEQCQAESTAKDQEIASLKSKLPPEKKANK